MGGKRRDAEMKSKEEKEEFAGQLAKLLFSYVPSNKLPQPCIDRVNYLSGKYGRCGEIVLAGIKEAIESELLDEKLGTDVK
jgi:hypothetical protein